MSAEYIVLPPFKDGAFRSSLHSIDAQFDPRWIAPTWDHACWVEEHYKRDAWQLPYVLDLGVPVYYQTGVYIQEPWFNGMKAGPTFMIRAGCRWLSYWDAKEHWLKKAHSSRSGPSSLLRANYMLAILPFIEDLLIDRCGVQPSRRTSLER